MAYNPFGEDTGVEDFSGRDATEAERKKRLATLAALAGGVPMGDVANKMIGDRIAPISQAIENPQAALQQRFGEPINRAEEISQALQGQQPQGPVGPVMPQDVAQQRQQQLPVGQTPPMQAMSPEQFQQIQNAQNVQLPQAGPGVQVAGPSQMPPKAVNPADANAPDNIDVGGGFNPAGPAATRSLAGNIPPSAEVSKTAVEDIHHTAFVKAYNSTDPKERSTAMAALMGNPSVPEGLRMQAQRAIYEDYQKQKGISDANKKMEALTPTDAARYLQERNKDGGSYVKAILLQRLGLTELAKQEQEKISPALTADSAVAANGERYNIYRNKAGEIVNAFNSAGQQASQSEVANLSANTGIMKGANIGSQLYRDPATGKSLTKVDTANGPIYYDSTGARTVPKGEPVPLTAGSDISTQLQLAQMKRQQNFIGQTAEERMRAFRETNSERALAGLTPLTPDQMGLNERGELIGMKQPGLPATPPAPGKPGEAAPVTALDRVNGDIAGLEREIKNTKPAEAGRLQILQQELAKAQQQRTQLGGAPAVEKTPTVEKTPAEMQAERLAKQEAAKVIVKPAAEQVAISADTQNTLNSIKKVEGILETGKHNIGSTAAAVVGRGPVAQAIGEQFETTDAKNTKLVLDTVNKLATDGLKTLGSNPSTADLAFWTENKPNGSTDPEVMKAWIKSRSEDMKRRLGYAEKQVGTGGGAGVAPEVNQVYPEKTVNGVTYIYDGKGWKKK